MSGLPSVKRWTTEGIEAPKRLEFWTDAICNIYLRLECMSAGAREFEGVLEAASVGQLGVSRMVASSQRIHNLAAAPGGLKDSLYLVCNGEAPWIMKQRGRLLQLRAGDVAVVDAREPYEVVFQNGAALGAVELPSPWLHGFLRSLEIGGTRIAREVRWGRVLSALCVEISRDLSMVGDLPDGHLQAQIAGLLVGALEPASPLEQKGSDALWQRAQAMLRAHIEDAAFAAPDAGAELGISLRSLHRLFAAHETTFSAVLRQLRMERAQVLLGNPALAGLPVMEIGRRCGFPHASQFVREFHRRYGSPPGTWRQRLGG